MKLLLASFLHPRLREFFDGEVLYINDAAKNMDGVPFVEEERRALAECGNPTNEVSVADLTTDEFTALLDRCSGVYVASGESFEVLEALKRNGNDKVLADAVRAGLPYAGSSAGAVIAGPTLEHIQPMDEPAEDLKPRRLQRAWAGRALHHSPRSGHAGSLPGVHDRRHGGKVRSGLPAASAARWPSIACRRPRGAPDLT